MAYPYRIRGHGGKGGSSGATGTQEDPDGLRARAYAKIIDLIGEGRIAGFCTHDNNFPNGKLLVDGQIVVQPTIVDGHLTGPVTILKSASLNSPASLGYPPAVYLTVTGDGKDGIILATSDAITGELNADTTIVDAGSGYTSAVISVPSVLAQAVFLDNIQLAAPAKIPNDTNNAYSLDYVYSDVTIQANYGDPGQAPLKGFDQAESIINDGRQQITLRNSPGFKTFTTTEDIDSIVVAVSVDSLIFQNVDTKNGVHIEGSSVEYVVEFDYTAHYKTKGDVTTTNVTLYEDTITGKASSKYVRSRQMSLLPWRRADAFSHTWTFRVKRLTADSASTFLQNNTFFEYAIGVTQGAFSYPYSAVVGISIDAGQFSSIPVRGYEVKLTMVNIPTNYFPRGTVILTGPNAGKIRFIAEYCRDSGGGENYDASGSPVNQVWDGSFYIAWTDNPAWCFYDLLTNERYGLGEYILKTYGGADKWLLYQIAQYCDEMVPDGFGGQEPRFTCNAYLQTRQAAFDVLNRFAACFRGMLYWAQGVVVATQDSKKDINTEVYTTFSVANVKGGVFTYSGTARRTRHNVAYVRWIDPDNNFQPAVEPVEDINGILRYGIQDTSINADFCTSRGQARRVGLWTILSEFHETETVTFRTGYQGATLLPGMVVAVLDNARSSVEYSGRILDFRNGRTQVVLDRKVGLDGSGSYLVLFIKPVGQLPVTQVATSDDIDKIMASQIATYPLKFTSQSEDGFMVLNFDSPIDVDVIIGSIWGIQSAQVNPQYFRLIGIDEVARNEFEVVGLEYHVEKFDAIDFGKDFTEAPISLDPRQQLTPRPPSQLELDVEIEFVSETQITYRINAHWDLPVIYDPKTGEFVGYAYVSAYEVWIREGLANYQLVGTTTSNQMDIVVPRPDDYCVKVYSLGLGNLRSSPIEACTTIGDTFATSEELVDGLELTGKGNAEVFTGPDAQFSWRINSRNNSFDFGSEPFSTGANSGGNSLRFLNYEVVVYEPVADTVVWSDKTIAPSYAFDFGKNESSVNGPYRDFIFEVRTRESTGKLSLPERIRVHNDLPAKLVIGDVDITSSQGLALFTFPPNSATDVAGHRIWITDDPGGIPLDTNGHAQIPPGYEGAANPAILPIKDKVTYYVRVAEFDGFSKDPNDVNISDQTSFVGNNPPKLSILDFMR